MCVYEAWHHDAVGTSNDLSAPQSQSVPDIGNDPFLHEDVCLGVVLGSAAPE
jgi:hypothetical protein